MQSLNTILKNLFNFKEASRSGKAKKNVIILFFLNGFNFLFTILIVPLTLKYLGALEYGIWLTLSSLLVWLSYLDFGIGNGLRNKLSEALANGKNETGKAFVSTAYAVFSLSLLILWIIFFVIYGFINWSKVLNSPGYMDNEIKKLVLVVFVLVSLQFLLKLIYSITSAYQKPAINGFISVTINFSSVLFVYFLLKTPGKSIFTLGMGTSALPVIILISASFFLYIKYFREIAPSLKSIKMYYAKGLVSLGLQFFVIQFAGLILFATDNMIIVQIMGPKEVTTYNIAYKYFFYISIIFQMILTPFWSAYTEAYVKGEFEWIKNSIKKIFRIWIILSIITVLMLGFSNIVYRLWVGSEIHVPITLSIVMCIFIIISNWNNIFVYFINGTGKIRIQFYSSIFVALINIPLSIYFAKYLKFGSPGIMLATCICVAVGSILAPIQYNKLINVKATGIWNK
ncbi:MAG: MATE family efflux transporter [Ignavibacteriaceae bacterium]